MELLSITKEIYAISQRLGKASNEIFRLGKAKAEAERDYKLSLSKEILKLRAEGTPVSILGDIARGNVSDLLFKRDFAEVQYKSALESMDVLKSQLSALQTVCKYQEDI